MEYESIILKDEITVRKIYTIHYFEYMKNFEFSGETHDFWEFVCVDKGGGIRHGRRSAVCPETGEIAFHQPNEFHSVEATRGIAPNLVVISLDARIPPWIFSETVSFRSMRKNG